MRRPLLFHVLVLFLLASASAQAGQKAAPMPSLADALKKPAYIQQMIVGGKDISGEISRYVGGGWGYGQKDACVLSVPGVSWDALVTTAANILQSQMAVFRANEELAATAGNSLECIHAEPQKRVMVMDRTNQIFEDITFTITCFEAETLRSLRQNDKALENMSETRREELRASARELKDVHMWFKTSDVVAHNIAAILGVFMPSDAARKVISVRAQAGVMPEEMQRSVYLGIPPRELMSRRYGETGKLVRGGWGHTRKDALVIALDPAEKGTPARGFLNIEEAAFSLRTQLEFSQPLSEDSRFYPVSHTKQKQSLVSENGKIYDKIQYTIQMLPADVYMEYLPLLKAGDSKGIEEKILPKTISEDREMWFDITAPYENNLALLEPGKK